MGRYILFIFTFFGAIFIAGCGGAPPSATPAVGITALSSPSPESATQLPPPATSLSAEPTFTLTVASTSTPAPVSAPSETPSMASVAPTASETPETAPLPSADTNAAAIQIFAPGPMSKVVSPIDLRMYIAPRAAGLTFVELYGEDGRLMARNVLRSGNTGGQFDKVIIALHFETNAAAELGRLQISTRDSHGRVQALKSVHLMLLSVGDSIITPEEYLRESVSLLEPPLLHTVSGGEVTVRGTMQVFNDQPVVVELIDTKGEILGSRFVSAGPADGNYHEINTTISYKVSQYTSALLVIRQADDRIPGPFYLFSQEIFLSP
jgi:hypothetical protein